MKYNGFLSYSHAADDALAPALQSALHRLARPWYQMRALRIFRDKTTLAASPELWPAIVAALEEAEFFLLLASPPAARSRWVQREIDWWLSHRSLTKLLILLTDGDLVWDEATSDFDWGRTNALPADLLTGRFASEPLWVDLRWAKSAETMTLRHAGFRLAVLDIAAPLHGRSKDELDGDDVRQFARVRRLAGAAIAALMVLTVAAATAAVIAVRQRDEAVRQSTLAEAGRLAAQADLLRERGGPVDDSVGLAAQALHLLDTLGVRSLEVDDSLRRALALLPRRLGSFEIGADDTLAIDPEARHVTLHALAHQVSVRRLPGGEAQGCRREAIAQQLRSQGEPKHILVQAITTDGSHCATVQLDAGSHQLIELWSAEPPTRLASVAHRRAAHLRIAVSDDAELMAITDRAQSGAAAAGRYRLWSRSRQADVLRQEGAEFVAFGPDRRHFAASDGVWRLAEGPRHAARRLLTWADPLDSLAFSASGRSVARRSGYDGDVEVHDLEAGKVLPANGAPPGTLLALSDDGRFLAFDVGTRLLVWDRELAIDRAQLSFPVLAARFRGNELIVLADETDDGSPARRVRLVAMSMAGAAQTAIEGIPAERTLWLGFDGRAALRLLAAGDALRIEVAGSGSEAPVTRARIDNGGGLPWTLSSDERHYAIAKPGGIVVGTLGGTYEQTMFATQEAPGLLALSGRAEVLAASFAARVQIWPIGGGAPRRLQALDAPRALRLSDDGRYLLTIVSTDVATRAGSSYTLQRWQVDDPSQVLSVPLGRHLQPPRLSDLVSGDGQRLNFSGRSVDFSIAAAEARVSEADLKPGDEERADGQTHLRAAGKLKATIDRQYLVVSDGARGQAIARLEHPATVQFGALSEDGQRAATVDEAGTLRVWNLQPGDLIAQACARRPKPISAATWAEYMPAQVMQDTCDRKRPLVNGLP